MNSSWASIVVTLTGNDFVLVDPCPCFKWPIGIFTQSRSLKRCQAFEQQVFFILKTRPRCTQHTILHSYDSVHSEQHETLLTNFGRWRKFEQYFETAAFVFCNKKQNLGPVQLQQTGFSFPKTVHFILSKRKPVSGTIETWKKQISGFGFQKLHLIIIRNFSCTPGAANWDTYFRFFSFLLLLCLFTPNIEME